MNKAEAIRILQQFGEGIDPNRHMDLSVPTHNEFHEALGVVCGIPWDGRHAEHHEACAKTLGIESGRWVYHAEHSTALLVGVSRMCGPRRSRLLPQP